MLIFLIDPFHQCEHLAQRRHIIVAVGNVPAPPDLVEQQAQLDGDVGERSRCRVGDQRFHFGEPPIERIVCCVELGQAVALGEELAVLPLGGDQRRIRRMAAPTLCSRAALRSG